IKGLHLPDIMPPKCRPQYLRSELRWLRRAEFREQLRFRVRPLKRFWMTIEVSKIVLQVLLERQRTRKVVRCEDVPLHLAKDNLDLRSEEHTSELQSRGHLV